MGKTTKFQLPYPEDSDVANVPLDMKKLAEKTEEILGEHEEDIEKANNIIPTTGTTGQVLKKKSDGSTEWADETTEVVNSKTIADKTKKTYSAEIIDGFNTYSTEEQVIGTWIDGKPIYRKTFTNISVANGETKHISLSSITNAETLTGMSGFLKNTYNVFLPLNAYLQSDQYISTWVNFGLGYMELKCYGYEIINGTVTLEYTKTTD